MREMFTVHYLMYDISLQTIDTGHSPRSTFLHTANQCKETAIRAVLLSHPLSKAILFLSPFNSKRFSIVNGQNQEIHLLRANQIEFLHWYKQSSEYMIKVLWRTDPGFQSLSPYHIYIIQKQCFNILTLRFSEFLYIMIWVIHAVYPLNSLQPPFALRI